MSEPTQQQKCADLAQAMGWRIDTNHVIRNSTADLPIIGIDPEGKLTYLPNPYESADDKDALVAWLAADDARWFRFLNQWERMLINRDENEEVIDLVREAMKGDRAIIADAAWLAI
jgi:hypothetical protein